MSNKDRIQNNNMVIQDLINKANNLPDYIDTSSATVIAKEVMKDKIAYGSEGKLIGTAPLSFVSSNNEINVDTYKLENVVEGINISTIDGNNTRHVITILEEDLQFNLRFEDESIIITSTVEVEEGDPSPYTENSLYVVYKEG